jgi:hypothetical protein
MTITFTLQSQYTGATYVAGPFNISGTTSGNTTYELAVGVTKSQLTTGYSINTVYETITGGTICSTGECSNCEVWTIAPPETPSVSLYVQAVDEDSTPAGTTLYYTINGGGAINLTTSEPFTSSCDLIGVIEGLNLGDVVVFSTAETYPMSGIDGGSCPPLSGTATTYQHTVGISTGFDYVSLAINSDVSV